VTVVRPRPLPDPLLRLVVLHHAGGSHVPFRRWARLLPAGWEACLVDAPGRGHAADVAPARTMDRLVHHLVTELAPLADRPYALFGHSMGAVVGFALCVELRARGLPLPVWLGVSAHPGPRTPDRRRTLDLHRLGSESLRTALYRIGGLPAVLLEDDELWDRIEPLLRADLEVAERWRPPHVDVLPVPVTSFCGRDDPVARAAAMQRWAVHTDRFLGVREFPGDHFYVQQARDEVVAAVVTDVSGCLLAPGLATSRLGGPGVAGVAHRPGVDQPGGSGPVHGVDPRHGSELLERVAQVPLHGRLGDREPARDLAVAERGRDQDEDLPLPR
jgi:surfactin synthase thioesterase subunit